MAPWGQSDSQDAQYVQSAGRTMTGPSAPISTAPAGQRSAQVPHWLHNARLISGNAQFSISKTTAFLLSV